MSVSGDVLRAERPAGTGKEVFDVTLPAVVTVREGLNLPRYPSVPGRIRAKKKPIATHEVTRPQARLNKVSLELPADQGKHVEILGTGADAAPEVVEVFRKIGVIS
jgi:electron transfer flavoprotein beta subunit